MRVDQSTSSAVQGSEAQGTKQARKTESAKGANKASGASEAKGASSNASARTEVSERAREMAAARSAANEAPEVREERIADLKARIAAGKYKVDSSAVADRLVDDHIRMSGIS